MIDDSIETVDLSNIIFDPLSGQWVSHKEFAKSLQEALAKSLQKALAKQYPAPEVNVDGKNMAVKSDTEEDRDRLWASVMDYARGG